ncbi:MAG: TetR/AcrR family transcriptional regulator, tetracycline repressor protein, partial [Pseudonocardiales bacterium]|nr:TetR/AcrR family transcriptional regulator, tetracycline repressor protein [Pseudonocardiales bacterium]
MARPKIPLISKRKALEVALDIIDNEGIESLSIRRLAERLKVNGASLYHHFENKEEIVVGAAKLALEEVRTPQTHDEPWRVWILRNARRLRQAFREHPDLVPVMLRRQPLGIGAAQMDATVALLEEENVPTGAIAPMLEALELYAIGSA